MAQQRLPMRKIRDVLRLSAAGLSKRQIASSLGIGPTAAGACLRRAREAGVGWPLPDDLDDAALERRLYPAPTTTAKDWRSLPDWPAIHRELRRKGGQTNGASERASALDQPPDFGPASPAIMRRPAQR